MLDTNNDKKISKEEINNAINILEKAKKQEQQQFKINMLNNENTSYVYSSV